MLKSLHNFLAEFHILLNMVVLFFLSVIFITNCFADDCVDSLITIEDSDTLLVMETHSRCERVSWETSTEKSDIFIQSTFYSNLINYKTRDTLYIHKKVDEYEFFSGRDSTWKNQGQIGRLSGHRVAGTRCQMIESSTSSSATTFMNKVLLFKAKLVELTSFNPKKNVATVKVNICYEFDSFAECENKKIILDTAKEVEFKSEKDSRLIIKLIVSKSKNQS